MQVKGQSAFRLNWKVITLLVSLLCVFVEEAKGKLTCNYEVLADNSVDDNYRVDQFYDTTQSTCEQLCTDRPGCSVAVYQDGTCYLYDEDFLTPQSDGGWTYLKKLSCSSAPATTTASTSTTSSDFRMMRKVSTSSTVAPVYRIKSVGQCEEACRLVLQCMAYTLNSTTCTLYNAIRYHNGSTVRVKCSGFTETSNMAGDDSMSLSYSATLESCESVCLRSRLCKAVVFNSDSLTCSLYLSIPTQKDDDPSLTLSWIISDEGEVFTFTSENNGHNGLTRLSSTLHMCVLPLLSGLLASHLLACR